MRHNYRILGDNAFISNDTYLTGINNNDLIIGPSGAGKTRTYVKPNIMQANESMIIADTKGNLMKEVSPVLKENGYNIISINYKDLSKSYGYNPFDYVRYDELKDKYSEQDILTIVSTLVPVLSLKDPFWELSAKMYLTCMIAYVLEALPKEEHNLQTIHTLLSILHSSTFENLIEELAEENPNSFALRQYYLFKDNKKAEKMNQSIIAILAEKLNSLFLDDAIAMYQSKKRIRFEDISKEKTAVFLIISDTDRSMDRLTSLFYTQSLQTLCNQADANPTNRLDIPVRFIFDDFATNTIIPDFDNIISVIRSREIYVSIILQSITQLDSIYGKEKATTIINNCDNCLYLGGQDVKTAELMATKANKPLQDILDMPLKNAYLFTRGTKAREIKKYDITKHCAYHDLPESNNYKVHRTETAIVNPVNNDILLEN